MECPNCKTELININGRFVCSDCGKEVPEAEINVAAWGSFGGGKVVPEPGAINVASAGVMVGEDEDFIVNDDSTTQATVTGAPLMASPVGEGAISGKVVIAEPKPEPQGFYSVDDTISVANTASETDLDKVQRTLDDENMAAVQIAQESPLPDIAPNISEPQVDQPGDHQATEIETTSAQDDLNILPGGGASLPEDPNIYRDAIVEDEIAEAEKISIVESKELSDTLPIDQKRMYLLIGGGVAMAVFLLAGGALLLVTVLTVGAQSLKAALVNPIKSLRTE